MYETIAAEAFRLAQDLRPEIAVTPLVRRPHLDGAGAVVYAKLENSHPTGSFKLRGASAKLLSLSPEQLRKGVVAASTGNHGAAVAYASARLDAVAQIFVSTEADADKVATIRDLGATITEIPGDPVATEIAARAESASSGRVYVSPYNDATVIAGQGTIGVELMSQLDRIDTVVVAVGGGGLISGIAAIVKLHSPHTRIVGASAANSAAMHSSVAAGRIVEVPHQPTLSDGTAGGIEADTVTFELCRELVDAWVTVEEDDIATALVDYTKRNDDRIEGSAALAVAAIEGMDLAGNTVVIICGGNVAESTLASVGATG